MADNDDLTMDDADEAAANDIKDKLQKLLNRGTIKGSFAIEGTQTPQLQSLQSSEKEHINSGASIGSEEPEVYRYHISMEGTVVFLGLFCKPKAFYVRSGYSELFNYVAGKWDTFGTDDEFRVILIGNAGTGKSWFQVYALKRLLDDPDRKYDIVIRQVGSVFYVIDLADASVYTWDVKPNHVLEISLQIKRALYFFEPGANSTFSPLDVIIPSLSTLSPFEERIKEYSKKLCSWAYFWPWSLGEMWAVVLDSGKPEGLDQDNLQERYNKFGGILRHALGEEENADSDLRARLSNGIPMDVLTSIGLNVDRKATGTSVSGYLVCYDNRLVEENRFSTKNLEYTSLTVEEAIANQLHSKPLLEKMQVVLKRLDGLALDLSGKMLEDVAMALLSQGRVYQWMSCQVGTGNWFTFSMTQRTITRKYRIDENLGQPNLRIAPTLLRFPVVDFLMSNPGEDPIVCFQCTWHRSHPFTIRALYDLRVNHLRVGNDRAVNIHFVCPSKDSSLATVYASRPKNDYLKGSLDEDLQFSSRITVPSPQLRAMWQSTNIFVLRPKKTWHELILHWLDNHT